MLRSALVTSLGIAFGAAVSSCAAAPTAKDESGSASISETIPAVANTPVPAHQRNSDWYRDASEQVAGVRSGAMARNNAGKAKNVVVFLGDGMSITTITAARILAGQRAGASGEENRLSFEEFPVTGLSKTYNVNSQTPDSAGTMSAIVTGVKTNIGMFGVDEEAVQDDCRSARGRELLSLLEIAELAGKPTGVISTARLTHATPASTYAKTPSRDWEDDGMMSRAARGQRCKDIARQFIEHREQLNNIYGEGASDGIEVAMGGGRRHFLPEGTDGGRRKDGRNLIDEWLANNPDGKYAANKAELAAVSGGRVLALFDDSHMDYAAMRENPENPQPSLPEMTAKALDLLQKNDEGFFLVVEAGRIDHAHHAGNAANALGETIEMAEAVKVVAERTDPSDTLILVTADHSHVFTMAGYPRRGNPILGKVVPAWSDEPMLDENQLPYTTLGYMNGRGFRDLGDEPNADATYASPPDAGRKDISKIDTTTIGYHQEALVPLNSETHSGEDVAVYASGPGAIAASGVNEQNLLFHVMLQASGWEAQAAARLEALKNAE
ncbi:MAG: alkaline phosphatase [Congregibacter sp.]